VLTVGGGGSDALKLERPRKEWPRCPAGCDSTAGVVASMQRETDIGLDEDGLNFQLFKR